MIHSLCFLPSIQTLCGHGMAAGFLLDSWVFVIVPELVAVRNLGMRRRVWVIAVVGGIVVTGIGIWDQPGMKTRHVDLHPPHAETRGIAEATFVTFYDAETLNCLPQDCTT